MHQITVHNLGLYKTIKIHFYWSAQNINIMFQHNLQNINEKARIQLDLKQPKMDLESGGSPLAYSVVMLNGDYIKETFTVFEHVTAHLCDKHFFFAQKEGDNLECHVLAATVCFISPMFIK